LNVLCSLVLGEHRPRPAFLSKILNPNQSLAAGYEVWTVERKSGGSVAGIIADETPTSITVRSQADETTIPRTDIASITALPTSAMPAGLESQLDEQQMADLLAFLKRE
jgi:putative heme-binding domain-containing protein